ncbi:MAG: hypothetical protein HY289_03160 [Planctomycetes bacterium]|nr:hypothetical protein [Planctomycetota bacterium]
MLTENATKGNHYSGIDRQLEAYAESWQRDHDAAKECWVLEDLVSIGLSVCGLLERAERAWRERVFRGVVEFDQEMNDKCRRLWDHWLGVTKKVAAQVDEMERAFSSVKGASELHGAVAKVSDHLSQWQAPRLSLAVGLREMTLTQQEADELQRRIEEARKNPPRMPTRKMEVRDASFLDKS